MYNMRKDGLTLISGVFTPSLEDKFLFRTVNLGINSFAMGPPVSSNSLNLATYILYKYKNTKCCFNSIISKLIITLTTQHLIG